MTAIAVLASGNGSNLQVLIDETRAGRIRGRLDESATLSLPGGELQVTWRGCGQTARLCGDAQLVYQGRVKV